MTDSPEAKGVLPNTQVWVGWDSDGQPFWTANPRLAEAWSGEPLTPFYAKPVDDLLSAQQTIEGLREECARLAENGRGEGTFGSSRGLEYLHGYMQGRKDAARDIRSGATP